MDTQNTRECIESTTEGPAYPLFDKWVLWAHLPHDTDWSLTSYIKLAELSNMEQVISLYQCIPALMIRNCMLFLMRKGINPTWEDPKNSKGGCFSFKVNNKNVPSVWKDLSYVLTGETVSSNPKFQHNIIKPINSNPFCSPSSQINKFCCKGLPPETPKNEVTSAETAGEK